MGVSKYTNELKQKTIDLGIVKQVANIKKALYKQCDCVNVFDDEGNIASQLKVSSYEKQIAKYRNGYNLIDCADRLLDSKKRKYGRAKQKIEYILTQTKTPVFLTLTFTDSILSTTTPETRRRYVARYLKEQCKDYVANIDFSPDMNREHYHAVIGDRVNMDSWQYGFTFAEQIRIHDHDVKRVSHYLIKLTSHAFKTNCTQRLIYSRD